MSNFPDRPATPTLSVNSTDPVHGDVLTLTCTSTTPGVTSYDFRHDGVVNWHTMTSNTLTLDPAHIGTDDGVYACRASISATSSYWSTDLELKRELHLLCALFFFYHSLMIG